MKSVPDSIISRLTLPTGEVWSEFYRKDGRYVLDWKQAARFSIDPDGSRIRFRPYPDAKSVSLRVLNRLARAYSASLRGEESLHATGLVRGNVAIALIGDSGSGKSTMAAWLLRRGWRLLSDDVLPFKIGKDSVVVRASTAHLKMSPNTFRHRTQPTLLGEFDPNLEKWVVRCPAARGSHRLTSVIRLYRQEKGVNLIRRIRGARAALTLQASFYNELLRTRAVHKNQFISAVQLAERVPLWRLSYPTGFKNLSRAAGFLDEFLRNL